MHTYRAEFQNAWKKKEMKEEIDKTTIIVGDSCLNNT